jgi:hypothetical protein
VKRLLAASLFAAVTLTTPALAGPAVPQPGGICEGQVDFSCRERPCGEDELDCGMILPCLVWVAGSCVRVQ